MDNTLKNLLNEQINMELYSAYLYHYIVLKFKTLGLDGFAKWYEIQTSEEVSHAKRIERFLMANDECPKLKAILGYDGLSDDPKDLLKLALEHERNVTKCIHAICLEALKQKDLPVMQFMDWFVDEQVEEERNAKDNLLCYENFVSNRSGLMDCDRHMGSRVAQLCYM